MDQRTMILIGVVVIAIVVVIAALFIERKRRSERLKQQFGPEYDRTLRQHGDAATPKPLCSKERSVSKSFPFARSRRSTAIDMRSSGPTCKSVSSTTHPAQSLRQRSW